jgi:hypothetical protein
MGINNAVKKLNGNSHLFEREPLPRLTLVESHRASPHQGDVNACSHHACRFVSTIQYYLAYFCINFLADVFDEFLFVCRKFLFVLLCGSEELKV